MKRREARESALKILYALEYNGDSLTAVVENLTAEKNLSVSDFTMQIVKTYLDNSEEVDKRIVEHLHNWDYRRVAVIDKILLRMAVTEFLYFEAIPPEATINEMIEIGKNYSTERSGKFINGILDSIHHKMPPGKKIKRKRRKK